MIKAMEKVLFAVDELTGLIWAAALMRPSKSTKDMELREETGLKADISGTVIYDEQTGQRPENESNRYCLYYIIKVSVESKVEAVGHKKEDFYEQKVIGNHRYAE